MAKCTSFKIRIFASKFEIVQIIKYINNTDKITIITYTNDL